MMDLPLDDDVNGLVWRVLSQVGIQLRHVVLLCWSKSTVGWVQWPSANQSLSPLVAELACKMTPNSSFSFPYCMYLVTVLFVPDFHIHVYCCECVMHVPR